MPRSFFDFLCELPSDPLSVINHRPAPQTQPEMSRELREQMRRLIAARRPPVPALRRPDGYATPAAPLLDADRLLSFGFEQPGRVRIGEEKDLEILKKTVNACLTRHFLNSRVTVNPGVGARSEQGRTIVPISVTVRTSEAGSSLLDLRVDRLSRDVEMVNEKSPI